MEYWILLYGLTSSFFSIHSILGALLIICGLYFVLWGKSKEMKAKKQLAPSETETSQEVGIIVTSPTKDTCSDNSRVDIGSSKK
jgi:hypothetical protein